MKHAYLILAHNEWDVLSILLSKIDDARNDIYIHVDKKATMPKEYYRPRFANCYFIDKRIDVRWASFSMIEAEYALFEEAAQNGPYLYYHLLSGVDLPIKNQDDIHDFFRTNYGKEFIAFATETSESMIRMRVRHWHLMTKSFRNSNFVAKVMRRGFILLQDCIGAPRNRSIVFKKGSQWCSVTNDFVLHILNHKDWVYSHFKRTFCPDELVLQTLCYNSTFMKNVYSVKQDGNMRFIRWRSGEIMMISEEDFSVIKKSNYLFARKFNNTTGKKYSLSI